MELKPFIRLVHDFPKPGVVFRDITPLLADPQAFSYAVDRLADWAEDQEAQQIIAIESRGFIFGTAVAQILYLPLILLRKPGKLPGTTVNQRYGLEYGKDELHMCSHLISSESRVVIVDDVLATGGTAQAATKIIEQCGGKVQGCVFLLEIDELKGKEKLADHPYKALLNY